MTDPLEGCRKRVERADVHFESLDKAVKTWGDSYPYDVRKQFDSDAGEYVLTLHKLRVAPLVDWGILIGDIIHSLRSTLDHLVCVVVRESNPQDSCFGTGFPILFDSQLWDKSRKDGKLDPRSGLAKIRGVDQWAETTIKSLQPFRPGKVSGRDHPLWILNELANIDKHRTLHVAEFFHYAPDITFNPPGSGEVTWVHPGGPLNDGAEVLRYRVTRSAGQSEIKTETKLGADITFDQGSSDAEGMNIPVLLKWLRDYVEWAVDLFGYKFFGGREPKGLQRAEIPATASITVSENE